MSKHTPGPWRIIDSIEQSKATIIGADFPAMGFVADVNLCRNNTHQQADGRANANLIAAAPAMYALLAQISKLRKAWRVIDGLPSTEYMDELDTLDIDAALAQAEGRG